MASFPRPPALPRVSKRTVWPNLATPQTLDPPDAEAQRQARWEKFRDERHASYPEFIVYEWITTRRKLVERVDFIFQFGFLGSRTEFGGLVIDFYFPLLKMAWFIQGLRYHYTEPAQRSRDIIGKLIVADHGLYAIELFEDDIIDRTDYTVSRALQGIQVSRRSL